MPSRPPDDLLSVKELSQLTGLSDGAIRWRLWAMRHGVHSNPPMPEPSKTFGGHPAWQWDVIEPWIEEYMHMRR